MRLLSFAAQGAARLGALAADGGIVDLAARSAAPEFGSMQALIEAGDAGLRSAARLLAGATATLDPAAVRWLAPLPCPPQMRDFIAFEQHMRTAFWQATRLRAAGGGPPAPATAPEVPAVWYQMPLYYKCNRFAVAGPGNVVEWPADSRLIDYELEIACVLGRRGRNIQASQAADHIFGFTIFNDLSARDLQFAEMQGPLGPAKGKDFDGANVLGPVIVTQDELGAQPQLAMRALVNGALWSEGHTRTMHWSFGQMIERASRSETLHPGEVLGSGTVGGGCGLELGRFLCHGDLVQLEIEHLGVLPTTIHAPHVTERPQL